MTTHDTGVDDVGGVDDVDSASEIDDVGEAGDASEVDDAGEAGEADSVDTDAMAAEIDAALSTRTIAIGWLRRPLLRLLAKGAPVSIDTLAMAAERPATEVLETLAHSPDTEYDDDGRIIGHGITLRPTPHEFIVADRTLYTWCALDTLAFPPLLDEPVQINSPCHTTGQPVRLTVTPDELIDVEPDTAAVSIVLPDPASTVRASFCSHIWFFADTDVARSWHVEHPHATLLPVAAAYELGRKLNTLSAARARSS